MNNNFLPYQLKKTNEDYNNLSTQLAQKAQQSDIDSLSTFVKKFGAIGDGVTDDTNAIKNALLDAVTNKRKRITFEKGKRYKITAPIIISMGTMKHFEVDFNHSTIYMGAKFSYTSGLLAFNFDKTLTDTVFIAKNGFFDGSGYPPDWTTTPPIEGCGAIHTEGARTLVVDNCHFNDWFLSSAIFTLNSDFIKITNCTGVNVGGMASTSAYDAAGDAIYIGKCGYYDSGNHKPANVLIENCNFKAHDVVVPTDTTIINSFHSGRCGVVLGEYANQLTPKNFTILNSYFYNYQRTFHIENGKSVRLYVANSTFEEFGNCVFVMHDNTWENILFENCNFVKNNDVRGMLSGNQVFYGGSDSLSDSPSYTQENIFKFDTCKFFGYISLVGNMKATDCVVDNCQVVTYFWDMYNCRIRAINSKFKINRNQVRGSIYNFEHCRIELGYLHDTNSIYVFSCTSGGIDSTLSKLSIIDKCRLINVAFYQNVGSTLSFLNSEFTYDSNFNLKSYSGTTLSGIFDLGVDQIKIIENCKFTNNSGATFSFFAYNVPSAYDDMLITKNTFKGLNINIFGSAGFKITFDNNKFYANSLALTYYIKTATLLVVARNNYFFDLSNGELNLASGSVMLNNYRLTSTTATAV